MRDCHHRLSYWHCFVWCVDENSHSQSGRSVQKRAAVEESNAKTIKVKWEEIFFAAFILFLFDKTFSTRNFSSSLVLFFRNSQEEGTSSLLEMDIYTSQQKEFFMRSSFRSSRII